MFTINSKLTDLKVKDRNIFKIIYSMNSHPVATPEMSVEEARCYILFFSEGPNLSAFIGLYLPNNDRKFFYAYASNPFPFEAAADVENEARQFAEDMGFLLDEISVGGMAIEDRNHWIEDQYIFGYRKPELPKEEPQERSGGEEEVKALPAEREDQKAKEEDTGPPKREKEEPPAVAAPSAVAQAPSVQEPVTPLASPPTASPVQPQQQGYPAPPAYPQAPHQYQQPHYPQQQGHPYAPQQPYPGYPPPGHPYAPIQPYPGDPQPMPPQLEVPELGEPAEPSSRQRPAAPPKPAARKKPSPQPAAREEVEEELPVEVEMESPPLRPRDLMQEAIRQGVVRPPKPKAQKAHQGVAGTVARDKEALARLLSSF